MESCKQLIGEIRFPIQSKPGQPERIDDEYVRKGVAEIFMEVEPLGGRRHVTVKPSGVPERIGHSRSSRCLLSGTLR